MNEQVNDEFFMRRCLQLAALGAGTAALFPVASRDGAPAKHSVEPEDLLHQLLVEAQLKIHGPPPSKICKVLDNKVLE